MRGNLLDTSIILLATAKSSVLPKEIKRAINTKPNFLSVISFWEVVIKSGHLKMRVGDPRIWWAEAIQALNASVIFFGAEHVTEIHALPQHHNDPFDRALIAQAISEDLRLLSTDTQMPQYRSAGLKLID